MPQPPTDDPFHRISTKDRPPLEFVRVCEVDDKGLCPDRFRDLIVIDAVHDGNMVPAHLLQVPAVAQMERDGTLLKEFNHVRDWGAAMVAEHLTRALGLRGYFRVRLARMVLDFNRFPGTSPPETPLPDRLAISEPLASRLNHEQKFRLLDEYYDAISAGFEQAVYHKLIKIAIHTYDVENATQTLRPDLSLLTRSLSYQRNSRLPYNLFPPIFPDVLAESTTKRILRDRVALTVAKAGKSVAHNYPYCLPDGSIEIRMQPWSFFHILKERFESENDGCKAERSYSLVWRMLLNTNLRDGDGEALSGFLHRFRRPPKGRESEFCAAREAYLRICDYLEKRPGMVEAYRKSRHRTSALGVEVRKDLVWRFDGDQPVEPREDNAQAIAEILARAIATYLEEDLVDAD